MTSKPNFQHLLCLAIFAIQLNVHSASAQDKLTLGFKGMLGGSTTNNEFIDFDYYLQSGIGVQGTFNLISFVGLETGLQFKRTGYSWNLNLTDEFGEPIGTGGYTHTFDYLIVPLYAKLKLKSFYTAGGINFGWNTNSHISSSNEELLPLPGSGLFPEVKSTNQEIHLAAGYEKLLMERLGLIVEAGFDHHISSLFVDNVGGDVKLWNFNIGVGLFISLI